MFCLTTTKTTDPSVSLVLDQTRPPWNLTATKQVQSRCVLFAVTLPAQRNQQHTNGYCSALAFSAAKLSLSLRWTIKGHYCHHDHFHQFGRNAPSSGHWSLWWQSDPVMLPTALLKAAVGAIFYVLLGKIFCNARSAPRSLKMPTLPFALTNQGLSVTK